MLKHLHIKNFALIEKLDIDFHRGFSVITGETGAGKSIILGAIGLLLGQRADSKTIKQGADKCIVEAHFDLSQYGMQSFFDTNDIEYDDCDCIVRREMTAQGKSRAFINDTPVPLALLKELGDRLIDVHSQHQNLLLNKQNFQLSVVDTIAEDEAPLKQYAALYAQYQDARRQLEGLRADIENSRMQADFLKFQYEELSAARLVDGEQEELEQKSDTMTHAEDIKSALYEADRVLTAEQTGVVGALKSAVSALRNIGRVYPEAAEMADRMDSCYVELKDVSQDVSARLDDIDFDPAELDAVNVRLDKIYQLQKKYHVESVRELVHIQSDIAQKLSHIENSDEALVECQQQVETLKSSCIQRASELTALRKKAAINIEETMQKRLVPMGMPHVRFRIDIVPAELSRTGGDKVSFLFSANTSTTLQPISQVASGGEIARVMLALKAMISGVVKLPTIIFDEIDTGVSGKIAEQMAQMMGEMGDCGRQVISITHLPQIAALGSYHYKVNKDETNQGTISRMRVLSDDERITEIAQMLSGSDVTDTAIMHAKELLSKVYKAQ